MNFIATPNRIFGTDADGQTPWWELDAATEAPSPILPIGLPEPAAEPLARAATQESTVTTQSSELMKLFERAEKAATTGDWRTAAELFLTMVEKNPTFGPAYVGLASASFALGDVTTGATALEHAITIYPTNPVLHSQLGVALAHSGHLERAQQAFLKVLDIEPNNVDAIVSLAHLCRAARHYVEAVELLDEAHRLDPQNPNVIGAIGTCALDLGDEPGGRASYQKLLAIAPEHPETKLLASRLAG
ncbi:MAG: tetratricopeptide repeat protein [Deltaproteobacteria bacterium]|nr:tetratricopeptide repeat protein [Deltaproteobacteria bacterium]